MIFQCLWHTDAWNDNRLGKLPGSRIIFDSWASMDARIFVDSILSMEACEENRSNLYLWECKHFLRLQNTVYNRMRFYLICLHSVFGSFFFYFFLLFAANMRKRNQSSQTSRHILDSISLIKTCKEQSIR
jgi:hypothetical protein